MPPCKDPILALAERTALVDGMVQRSAGDKLWPAFPAGSTLLAVGGYGRRHLFPYSDVDLLLLVESGRLAQEAPAPISAFLQTLWDSGLRLSHSVRTPEECAEIHDQNIELNVSLLDQRYLAGDRALYARFAERLPRFLHAQRDPLDAQPDAPHPRTPPEVSEHLLSSGAEHQGHARRHARLSTGALAGADSQCGSAAHEPAFLFMARLRCFLHSRSGRDNNALTFDAQEEAAEYFAAPGTAQWMRDYFRHARDLYRAAVRELELSEAQSSSLFAQFKDWRTRLSNADFSVARERVHVRAPHALEADPELALRLFQFVARHGIRPSTETEQRVAAVAPQLAEWFSTPRQVWPAIEEILSLPYAADAVRSMHDTGVLRAVFPRNGANRVPGDTRLLSSLHGGRAHAGDAAGAGGTAREPRTGGEALYGSVIGDGRSRVVVVRAAVSRCRQGRRERGARGGVGARGRAGDGAHRDAAARARSGDFSDPAASGNVRRDELARPAGSGHRA
jgi:[protein-PII] uridylyltransferase